MTASGIKPTRIEGEGLALPDEVSIDAVYTGDDADWDSAPGQLGFDQWKQPVRCATTASVTIATALNAGDTIDGVTLASGDRVLVKNQATASQNGVYVVAATPYRAPDLDEDAEVLGAVVFVIDGTANAGTGWAVTNDTAPAVDTDAITWAAFGGGTGPAGDGNDTSLSTVAASGATETLDVSVARTHDVTLTADCTFTFTGAVTAEAWYFTLILRQDGTGGWDVTWPGSVAWPGGTAPTLTTTASTAEVLTFFTVDGGTVWYGFLTGAGGTSSVAALDDLTDVTITAVAEGHILVYRSGTWVNESSVPGRWELVVTGSAPPVAMTTDDETDFLYAEV